MYILLNANLNISRINCANWICLFKDTPTICIFTKLQSKVVFYAFCHVWNLWLWPPVTMTSSKKISPNFIFAIPGLQENFWSWKCVHCNQWIISFKMMYHMTLFWLWPQKWPFWPISWEFWLNFRFNDWFTSKITYLESA